MGQWINGLTINIFTFAAEKGINEILLLCIIVSISYRTVLSTILQYDQYLSFSYFAD